MLQENNLKYGRIGRDLLSFTVNEKEYTNRNVVLEVNDLEMNESVQIRNRPGTVTLPRPVFRTTFAMTMMLMIIGNCFNETVLY